MPGAGAAAGAAAANNANTTRPGAGAAAGAAAANNNPPAGADAAAGAALANNNRYNNRPGADAAAGAAVANANNGYGTRYTAAAAYDAQSLALRANANYFPAYSVAALGAYANAWQPTHVVAASLYSHPGYSSLAVGLGLAATPVAYDYGGNVVTQANTVYVNGDPAGTTEEYAAQATQIAGAGQAQPPNDDTKWLPLGVFALCEGDATTSDDVFQLAVDQQGVLRGNYHNLKSDSMEPLSGSVDKSTQRVAWTIGSDQMPVYDVGLVNLTKDVTPLLVHTADGQTRQVTLVRLPDPAPTTPQ